MLQNSIVRKQIPDITDTTQPPTSIYKKQEIGKKFPAILSLSRDGTAESFRVLRVAPPMSAEKMIAQRPSSVQLYLIYEGFGTQMTQLGYRKNPEKETFLQKFFGTYREWVTTKENLEGAVERINNIVYAVEVWKTYEARSSKEFGFYEWETSRSAYIYVLPKEYRTFRDFVKATIRQEDERVKLEFEQELADSGL